MATARSADLGAVEAIRCFADRRAEAERLVLVDGWSFRSVDDWVRLAWVARGATARRGPPRPRRTVTRGWQRVTLVAPAAAVRHGRAELEQAGPPPATRGRRAKKASA